MSALVLKFKVLEKKEKKIMRKKTKGEKGKKYCVVTVLLLFFLYRASIASKGITKTEIGVPYVVCESVST